MGVGAASSVGGGLAGSVEGPGVEGVEVVPLLLFRPILRLTRFFGAEAQAAVMDLLSELVVPFMARVH